MARLFWPTRRSVLAGLLVTPAVRFSAFAQDMEKTEDVVAGGEGDIAIRPFHHASLLITWNGKRILVDPAPAPGAAEGADVTAEYLAAPAPDVVLVTHEHGDHFNADILSAVVGEAPIVAPQAVLDKLPDELKRKAQVLANGASATVADIPVEAVPAYNITPDRLKYHPKDRHDNGYVLTLGRERIYIAGDTEDIPEMRALTNIDAAFLPMNLPYTMDVEHAADAVKAFKPKIVYPYHYGESDVQAFKQAVGDASEVRLLKWY